MADAARQFATSAMWPSRDFIAERLASFADGKSNDALADYCSGSGSLFLNILSNAAFTDSPAAASSSVGSGVIV